MRLRTHGCWPAILVVGCLSSASSFAHNSPADFAHNSPAELTIKLLLDSPQAQDAEDFKKHECPTGAPKISADPDDSKCKDAKVILYPDGTSSFKSSGGKKGSFCLAQGWSKDYANLQGRIIAKGKTVCLNTLKPGAVYSIRELSQHQVVSGTAAKRALEDSALFELQVWGTFVQVKDSDKSKKSAKHFEDALAANKAVRTWMAGTTYTSTNKNPLKSWLASSQRANFTAVKEREAFERALPDADLTPPEWARLLIGSEEQMPTLATIADALLPPQLEMAQALANHYSVQVVQPLFIGTLPATSNVLALHANDGVRREDIASGKNLLAVYGYDLKTPKTAAATGDKLSALPTQDIAIRLSPATQAIASGIKVVKDFDLARLATRGFEPLSTYSSSFMEGMIHIESSHIEAFTKNDPKGDAITRPLSPDAKQVLVSALETSSKFALLGYTSSVLLLHEAGENKQYRFAVCQNVAACDEKTDDQSITSDLRIRARTHPYVSLGTELTMDVPLYPGRAAYGGYQFVQVSGGLGPNKLYELQPSQDFAQQLTISALLIAYPLASMDCPLARGTGVALEGGLFRGGQPAFLSQWGFRILYEPQFARGLFISTGLSWRSVSVPVGLNPGTLIAVPSSSESAPAFNGRITWIPAFSVGFGVDLGVVGEAMKGVGDAFSGARAAPTNGVVSAGGQQ